MSLFATLDKIKRARSELKGLIERAAVIFIDLTDSTYYKDEKGIEEGVGKTVTFNIDVTKIIIDFCKAAKQSCVIDKYEVSKYIGDEVMAYVQGEECVKTVVEIAVGIQKYFKEINTDKKNELEKFKPKISIDYGDVLFAQYFEKSPLDPQGGIVDRAARIISLAKPYQILLSDSAKSLIEGRIEYQISAGEPRKFKGIADKVNVYEIVWDVHLGCLGIRPEENNSAIMISADEPTVFKFIEEKSLIERSKRIDLCLYTYETLAGALRYKLQLRQSPIHFRILIRHPLKDPKKEVHIKSSISSMVEVMSQNPRIRYDVRFYDEEPLLRTYIFTKHNDDIEALLGFYKYDSSHNTKFLGAEFNQLFYCRGSASFERHLVDVYQGRFSYIWEKLSTDKAVIFDLDGVLIDSMPYYFEAWNKAFEKVGINVSKGEIYEREGEKRELTAVNIYKKYTGQEPGPDVAKIIVNLMAENFKRIFDIKFMPGALELLTNLKDKGIKLGLVTGSVSLAEIFRNHNDFLSLFDVVVSGEQVEKGKPDPEPYQLAVTKLRIKPQNCIVVENAPLGIKSAVSAGITCFAISGTSPLMQDNLREAGASQVYKDFNDIRKHLNWVDTNLEINEFLSIFKPN